jgi:hypothetical protein
MENELTLKHVIIFVPYYTQFCSICISLQMTGKAETLKLQKELMYDGTWTSLRLINGYIQEISKHTSRFHIKFTEITYGILIQNNFKQICNNCGKQETSLLKSVSYVLAIMCYVKT